MPDDIAFKIQLGLVLPKLDEKLNKSITAILEEVMDYLKKGTLPDEDMPVLSDVKTLFMQNMDIFLEKNVLPAIEAKLNPPEPEIEKTDSTAEGKDTAATDSEPKKADA